MNTIPRDDPMPSHPEFFPMQGPDIGEPPLPWAVAQAIYDHLYVPLYGSQYTLTDLARRGGFSYVEIKLMAAKIRKESS